MSRNFEDKKVAVVLINMGGPESESEIKEFIRSLLGDPFVTGMPGLMRSFLSWMVSTTRAPRVAEHYRMIGGKSPLREWTRKQAEKAQSLLKPELPQIDVCDAYSYSEPRIDDKLAELADQNYERIVAVPMYPQFARSTLGRVYFDLALASKKHGLKGKLSTIPPFYDHPDYIQAKVARLEKALAGIDLSKPYHVLFSAHALPQSHIAKGDPYGQQIDRTVMSILDRHPLDNYTVCFQSKIGPVKWMQPSTIDSVRKVALDGVKQVVVMPVGFVCDHLETLFELDIELREIAEKTGIDKFVRAEVFNDGDDFIELIGKLVMESLDG